MSTVTRPYGMSLHDWAAQAVLDLDEYGPFGRLLGDDWRGWARQLFNNSALGRNLPDPNAFDDWRDWAERLCASLA